MRSERPAAPKDGLHSALRVLSVALMAVGFWGTVSLVHVGRRMAAEPAPAMTLDLPELRAPHLLVPPSPPAQPRWDHTRGYLLPLGPSPHTCGRPLGLFHESLDEVRAER